MRYKLVKLHPTKNENLQNILSHFETQFIYPLGNDFFKIDHGKNYFAFFKELGEPVFYGLTHNEQLIAMGGGILRTVNGKKVWYLCDMKALPEYKGQRMTQKLFRKVFIPPYYLKCGRGYAISMNPKDKENFMVKILEKMSWLPIKFYETLFIYQFTQDEFQKYYKKLNEILGPFIIKNNMNKKDIVLQSDGLKLNLNHLIFTQEEKIGKEEVFELQGIFMFCLPSKNTKNKLLNDIEITHSSSASIVGHRMKSDWNFINTSEI